MPALSQPAAPETARRLMPAAACSAIAAGLALLGWLWLGPLPQMSRTAFSPHMILHLAIVVGACPLLAFGLTRLLPRLTAFGDSLSWAMLATLFEMVVVWGWHVPLAHAAAARLDAVFVVQQLSFVAAGLAVWSIVFAAGSRAALGVGALALFLTFMHMSMFGLVVTLTPRLLYAPDLCLGAFGLSGLDDQHFGGALMTIAGGMPYLLAATVAAWRCVATPHERAQA